MTDSTKLIERLREETPIESMRRLQLEYAAAALIEQQSEALKGAAVIADTAGAEIRKLNARIAELESRLAANGADIARDAERLDFLIEYQAWVQWKMRDGSICQCQVWDQDPDEDYHILSGDDRYFNTAREAIDAAIAASAERGE